MQSKVVRTARMKFLEKTVPSPERVTRMAYHRVDDSRPKRAYRPKEERIALIRQDAEEGVPSVELIAQIEELSPYTVRKYASESGIALPRAKKRATNYGSIEERIALIRQDAEEGVPSVELIAQIEGVTPSTVRYIANLGNIQLPKKGYHGCLSPIRRMGVIRQSIEEGVNSLEELCRRTNLKPSAFRRFCDTYSVELPSDLVPYRYKPEMDVVIDRGGTLEEIGRAGGYKGKAAKENGNQYTIFSGQHETWLHNREEAKQAKKANECQIYQELASVLEARVAQLAENASWPERMALCYVQSLKFMKQQYSYRKLIKLFAKYESAKNKGRKLSLEELGKPLGMYTSYVWVVLSKVGLKPFHKTRKHVRYSSETQKAVTRASRFKISGPDVSYFLGISLHYASHYGGSQFKPHSYLARIGKTRLTYRLASQIYEAQDAGFKRSEIAELLDTSNEVVAHTIKNRSKMAPKIVSVLRVLYDIPTVAMPYRV